MSCHDVMTVLNVSQLFKLQPEAPWLQIVGLWMPPRIIVIQEVFAKEVSGMVSLKGTQLVRSLSCFFFWNNKSIFETWKSSMWQSMRSSPDKTPWDRLCIHQTWEKIRNMKPPNTDTNGSVLLRTYTFSWKLESPLEHLWKWIRCSNDVKWLKKEQYAVLETWHPLCKQYPNYSMYTNIFALNFACFITWSSLIITMITCVESKNPFMETLPEFPPKKVPVLEKNNNVVDGSINPFKRFQDQTDVNSSFRILRLFRVSRLLRIVKTIWIVRRLGVFWGRKPFGGNFGRGSTWGRCFAAGFCCGYFVYVDLKKVVVKQPDTLQASKTFCVLVAKTVQSLVILMVEASFLLDWLAACHLKPSRGFVGALRTLVSSLVDTLHLGSKSSKLVMFHVTFANPTLEEWDGKSWKIRKPLFWAMVLLFIIIYIAGAESLWMWKLSESRWFLIIMSIESGDLSRYQEQ